MRAKTNAVIKELKNKFSKSNTRKMANKSSITMINGKYYKQDDKGNNVINTRTNSDRMKAIRKGSDTPAVATIPTYKPFEATPYIKVSGLQKNTKRLSCSTANSGRTYTCTPAAAGGGKTRKSTRR